MGASEWYLFAPYQSDIEKLIALLREEAFQNRSYYNSVAFDLQSLKNLAFEDYDPYENHPRYWLSQEQFNRIKSLTEPETVEDLVLIQASGGTHCIIDIDGVSPMPEGRMATSLSDEQLFALFGTLKPTREMVEEQKARYNEIIDRWMAFYVIVYKNDLPDEIFFYGITGD
jgi:hypothetical protein